MATKTAKNKRIYKIRKEVKSTLLDVNRNVLTGTENLLDNSIKTGEKWQKLWAKALKNSEPIMAKQVDLVFDTLEGLADQIKLGRSRFDSLMGNKKEKPVSQRSRKTVAKTTTAAAKAVKKVKKSTKDDLTLIKGIGAKMEVILNNSGIKTYEDLAKTSVTKLRTILNEAGSIFKLQNPSGWAKEAKILIK